MFQTEHSVLPRATEDEFNRQEFCASLRKFFITNLLPKNKQFYEGALLPGFKSQHGRDPSTGQEVRNLLEDTFYFRGMSLLGRATQELMWETVGESIERQIDDLIEKASPDNPLGTVRVNPELKMPKYIESVDIHLMPGNFQTELGKDDIFAGALYDRGVYVFSYGGLGGANDGMGVALASYVKERFPDFKPRRILDMGCGPGFTTLPWADVFPDAEIHGIDIGAPMVRYAHGRAESMGRKIHFSQQDNAHTDFPDGYFDIVFSLLVLHECPVPAINAMLKEGHRVLAPNGIMLHDGGTLPNDPYSQCMAHWFSRNINEPFAATMRNLDYRSAFAEAGFDPEQYFSGRRESVYLKEMLPSLGLVGAIKT